MSEPEVPPDERDFVESERVAKLFHEAYELLAPSFGYKTREETRVPWAEVPENNRLLMISVVSTVRAYLADENAAIVKALREERAGVIAVLQGLQRSWALTYPNRGVVGEVTVLELLDRLAFPSVPAVSAEEE